MMKGEITVLSGLPGAGKTTAAEGMRREDPELIVVSRDAMRAGLFGDRPTTDRDEAHLTAQLIVVASRACKSGYRVVVDDLTLDNTTRRLWLALIVCGLSVQIIEIPTPIETCIERDAARSHPVGAEKIREFAAAAGA